MTKHDIEQDLKAFESWYQQHHGRRDMYERDVSGEYADKQVQGAFNVWQAAIEADRQRSGEPIAWMTHHDEPMLFTTYAEAASYCDDDEDPIPLYDVLRPYSAAMEDQT